MNSHIQFTTIQNESFGNYLKDIWTIAMFLVLFQHQTSFSLPFVWISLQFVIGIVALFIFRKTGPSIAVACIVPTIILLLLFAVDAPFWLYAIALGLSTWRIHARYNLVQDEQSVDSNFTLLFFIAFLAVYFFSFLMRFSGYSTPLFTLLISGAIVFVGIRLFTIWISTDKGNSLSFFRLLFVYITGVFGVSALSIFIYWIVDDIRKLVDDLLGVIISVAVIPLGPFVEYIVAFLDNLRIDQIKLSARIPAGEDPELEKAQTTYKSLSTVIPWQWIIIGIVVIVVLFIVIQIRKRKTEQLEVKTNHVHYENNSIIMEEEQNAHSSSLYGVESSILRETYTQFEINAQSYEFIREKSETVREWFERMHWNVHTEFFLIYEEVRYGGQTIQPEKADLFMQTLKEIENNFFIKKEV